MSFIINQQNNEYFVSYSWRLKEIQLENLMGNSDYYLGFQGHLKTTLNFSWQ
jgi:hypothetical protein